MDKDHHRTSTGGMTPMEIKSSHAIDKDTRSYGFQLKGRESIIEGLQTPKISKLVEVIHPLEDSH